jgi:hypothetical protein
MFSFTRQDLAPLPPRDPQLFVQEIVERSSLKADLEAALGWDGHLGAIEIRAFVVPMSRE